MPLIKPDGRVITRPLHLVIPGDGKRRLDDWIATFLDYTDQLECPVDYLRWAALSAIAGAAQRKVYMDMEYFMAMSNMYIVLTGPPGSKKSTAIRAAKRLLTKVEGVNMSSDAPSVAGLMEEFKEITSKEHQSLNAYISELSTLYENAKESMTGFLTAMYDGDPDYIKRTIRGGKETIAFPWLNLLAGTTPTWLGDNLTKTAIEGGMVARTIYVHSDEMILKSPIPEGGPRYDKLKEDLVHDLAHIAQLSGQFGFEGGKSGAAYQWYHKWYLDRSRFPRVSDNRTTGYYVRKPIHILKVAMALSLSRKDELLLDYDTLQLAAAFLESIEVGMPRAFSSVGGNEYANDIDRIMSQIQTAGPAGLHLQQILAANLHNLEKKFIMETLDTLTALGWVKLSLNVSTGQSRYYINK